MTPAAIRSARKWLSEAEELYWPEETEDAPPEAGEEPGHVEIEEPSRTSALRRRQRTERRKSEERRLALQRRAQKRPKRVQQFGGCPSGRAPEKELQVLRRSQRAKAISAGTSAGFHEQLIRRAAGSMPRAPSRTADKDKTIAKRKDSEKGHKKDNTGGRKSDKDNDKKDKKKKKKKSKRHAKRKKKEKKKKRRKVTLRPFGWEDHQLFEQLQRQLQDSVVDRGRESIGGTAQEEGPQGA